MLFLSLVRALWEIAWEVGIWPYSALFGEVEVDLDAGVDRGRWLVAAVVCFALLLSAKKSEAAPTPGKESPRRPGAACIYFDPPGQGEPAGMRATEGRRSGSARSSKTTSAAGRPPTWEQSADPLAPFGRGKRRHLLLALALLARGPQGSFAVAASVSLRPRPPNSDLPLTPAHDTSLRWSRRQCDRLRNQTKPLPERRERPAGPWERGNRRRRNCGACRGSERCV